MIVHKICFTLVFISIAYSDPDIICAEEKHDDECEFLQKDGMYNCKIYSNKLDCLIAINNASVQFGRINPDEALLARHFLQNITVIANVAPIGNYENTDDELIVMVKNNISSFDELKGKKMCHPGYGKLHLSRYYLNKFDELVLNNLASKRCDENLNTIVEKRYWGLNNVFGESCYPGSWVYNTKDDTQLKQRYKKLCAACNPSTNCLSEDISDPFQSAIDCYKNASIVLLTKHVWTKNKLSLNSSFLCWNEENQKLYTDNNFCSWGKRSKTLLVADSKNYAKIRNNIVYNTFKEKIIGSRKKKRSKDLSPYLNSIVFPYSSDQLLPVDNVNLENFLQSIDEPAVSNKCDKPIKWCTISSKEFEKCLWLKQATINQGIIPTINCFLAKNQTDCIDKIISKDADITNLQIEYASLARKKGLEAIAYPEIPKSELTKTMFVIKDTNQIKSFSDLKQKFGCFSEFGDLAFVSFIEHLQNNKIIKEHCSNATCINKFIGRSCAPAQHEKYKTNDNLCYCDGLNADLQCKFNNNGKNNAALKCLAKHGDYAVITNTDIDLNRYNDYTLLCKNDTLASYKGLTVDEECYIVAKYNSELVIRHNDKNKQNVIETLSALEQEFGQNGHSFKLFQSFNGSSDLLFKDSTSGLSFNIIHSKQLVLIYENNENSTNAAFKLQFDSFKWIFFYIFFWNCMQQ